jgi:hypothetical protein
MKLVTDAFKVNVAKQFVEGLNETANTIYYIGAHRSVPFADDIQVPDPENNENTINHIIYDELLFGKHVTPSDVVHMIRNIPWVSGTIYDKYDDLVLNLKELDFYVVSPESGNYHVFKCLDNNGGIPSVDQPLFSETAADDELYRTSDGYQWKYMFTVTQSQYTKFATTEYIPIFENADVTANAINGAIETIVVESGGQNYNSYATGTIKEAAVAGNTQLYSLEGERFTDYLITVDDVTGFVEEKVTSLDNDGNISSGVIVSIFPANNTVQITNTVYDFVGGKTLTGVSSNTSALITSTSRLTNALSANTDFYKNNAFYIKSGPGAGQLRTISEYIITGTERRVLLNQPLSELPDSSSIYEIGPNVIINGDGRGARAIAEVNPSANTISAINIVNRGSDYTAADITIIANTGLIDTNTSLAISTTSASARAILGPKGGHGANVFNEFNSNKVGVSVDFANTESGTIPVANDYRKISLIQDPLFANVEITLASSIATNFTAGETVTQTDTGATGLISNRDDDTLRLTNIQGFFETGNSSVNLVVGDSSNTSAEVTTLDRQFETFDQRETFQVEITYTGPTGSGFIEDELVIQPGISSVSSDLVRLTIDTTAFAYNEGEVITQPDTGAQGTVSNRFNSTLELFNTSGIFLTGNSTVNVIQSGSSNTQASVLDVDNTLQADATGNIHEINGSASNTSVISLSNVKGTFAVSDDVAGVINTFVGQQSGAVAKINGRDETSNEIIDESGRILYVEHFQPIERQQDQSERIKLIIEF